jgi:hypothetical protein
LPAALHGEGEGRIRRGMVEEKGEMLPMRGIEPRLNGDDESAATAAELLASSNGGRPVRGRFRPGRREGELEEAWSR